MELHLPTTKAMWQAGVLAGCLISLLASGEGVDPRPSRPGSPTCGAVAADCSTVIGFSGLGLKGVHSSGLASYSTVVANPGGGFYPETGAYTSPCSGHYFFTFSTYPNQPTSSPTIVSLKKLSCRSGSQWESVVAAGGGGGNQALIRMDAGDQVGLFIEPHHWKELPLSTSFSGFHLDHN